MVIPKFRGETLGVKFLFRMGVGKNINKDVLQRERRQIQLLETRNVEHSCNLQDIYLETVTVKCTRFINVQSKISTQYYQLN